MLPRRTSHSSNGCWTCRLRHKKCDERHPICDVCAGLCITCHYDLHKPEWMDGGVRQEEMAKRLKRDVKEKASHRRRGSAVHISSGGDSLGSVVSSNGIPVAVAEATMESTELSQHHPRDSIHPKSDFPNTVPGAQSQEVHNNGIDLSQDVSTIELQVGVDCKDARANVAMGGPDTILLMAYLDSLFPFLFPFYRPCLLRGGRAWILELMLSSSCSAAVNTEPEFLFLVPHKRIDQ